METSYHKIFFSLAAVCALLIPASAISQTMTIEQCEKMALENNYKLKNSLLDKKIAVELKKEAFTNYFPVVKGDAASFGANGAMAKTDIALPEQLAGAGTTIPLDMMYNGNMLSVTATQPIFAGGRIKNWNKLAKVGERTGEYKYRMSVNYIYETTEKYFWQLASLEEKLKTISTIEKQLSSIHGDVAIAVNAGITTRNDLLKVELQQQDISSIRFSLEDGIDITKLALRQFMGDSTAFSGSVTSSGNFDMNAGFDITYASANFDYIAQSGINDSQVSPPRSYYLDPDDALHRRTEFHLLDEKVKAAELQKRLEIGKYMPSMGIGAGYVYHDILNMNTNFGMVFATLSVPVSGWWGGSHSIKASRMKLKQAHNYRTDNSQLLKVDIIQKWNKLNEAYKQLMLGAESIKSSAENLRMNRNFYKAGTISISDLLDAQTIYRRSCNKYTDAYADYMLRICQYMIATGR
ncbi:MAG: TolC family protein [Bacteroidales bacterium]|jgi:outer membrane protein TolC|nr:TolC family protein [Bacteroidales bacterium]